MNKKLLFTSPLLFISAAHCKNIFASIFLHFNMAVDNEKLKRVDHYCFTDITFIAQKCVLIFPIKSRGRKKDEEINDTYFIILTNLYNCAGSVAAVVGLKLN